jgi:hypothetical protein
MNDRFKFRAWDKACNQMISLEKDEKYYSKFKVTLDLIVSYEETWCTGDLILMQCTGLRDSNEKLIYEGDCLDGIGFVVWNEERSRWGFDILGHLTEVFFDELGKEELEIIGNIYENRELLEKKL